jgi:hypothetical protein
VEVKLAFRDHDGPLGSEPCELEGCIADGDLKTDGSGCLSVRVPVTTREVEVRFPRKGLSFRFNVGDLAPVSELTGVQQRLAHLHYYHGRHFGTPDESTRSALRAFQRDHALTITGEPDEATREKLRQEHGS